MNKKIFITLHNKFYYAMNLSVAKYQFSNNNYNFEEARRALVRFVSTLLTL